MKLGDPIFIGTIAGTLTWWKCGTALSMTILA
jgi:hypothetical protein